MHTHAIFFDVILRAGTQPLKHTRNCSGHSDLCITLFSTVCFLDDMKQILTYLFDNECRWKQMVEQRKRCTHKKKSLKEKHDVWKIYRFVMAEVKPTCFQWQPSDKWGCRTGVHHLTAVSRSACLALQSSSSDLRRNCTIRVASRIRLGIS